MLVETYEMTEVDADGDVECDVEAMALIESLGLEGQKKLISRNAQGETRCPYRKVTREEMFTIENVCPKTVSVDKYGDGPIPLRVLQVAAHARDLFSEIEVRCPENGDVTDPFLLGVNAGSGYSREYFLLARWGTELKPLSEMTAQAFRQFRAKLVGECQSIARRAAVRAELFASASDSDLIRQQVPVAYHLD